MKRKMKIEDSAKKSEEQVTIIEIVLDASGSMGDIRDDTLGGLNTYITDQREQRDAGLVRLSLTQFRNSSAENLYNMIPIENMGVVTSKEYTPSGGTPLLDAVGTRIVEVDKQLKDFETLPSILFVIITDGGENTSSKYTGEMIADLIKEHEGKGWVFAFLGANQDAWNVGTGYGMSGGSTMNFQADGAGVRSAFASASISTQSYRSAGSQYTDEFFAPQDALNLAKNIQKDVDTILEEPINEVPSLNAQKKTARPRAKRK